MIVSVSVSFVGYLNVTLLVFSGRVNPEWQIDHNSRTYQEILTKLSRARESGHVYQLTCAPPKTGYKGIVVHGQEGMELILGRETVQLQLLLYDTMPSNMPPTGFFRQRIRDVIASGFVSKECPARVRRKRYEPPYNPKRWNDKLIITLCNNCYNYAATLITYNYAQPGFATGRQYAYARFTNAEVHAAAVRDGFADVKPQPGLKDPVPNAPAGNRHLVALFVAKG